VILRNHRCGAWCSYPERNRVSTRLEVVFGQPPNLPAEPKDFGPRTLKTQEGMVQTSMSQDTRKTELTEWMDPLRFCLAGL
jgi:hypothetical protein